MLYRRTNREKEYWTIVKQIRRYTEISRPWTKPEVRRNLTAVDKAGGTQSATQYSQGGTRVGYENSGKQYRIRAVKFMKCNASFENSTAALPNNNRASWQ